MEPIYEKIIYDLLFAYVNKDEDCPHAFEIEALKSVLQVKHEVTKQIALTQLRKIEETNDET